MIWYTYSDNSRDKTADFKSACFADTPCQTAIGEVKILIIKQLFIIRSKRKLFWGLSFAVSAFSLFYTLLCVLVLDEQVPWHPFSGEIVLISKYLLFVLPALSLLLCILLFQLSHKDKLPWMARRKAPTPEGRAYQQGIRQVTFVGGSFLLSLFLFFRQMDRLDTAKGISGFSPIVWGLLLLALIIFLGYMFLKLYRSGEPGASKEE